MAKESPREIYMYGFPGVDTRCDMESSANSPFLGAFNNDMSLLDSGLYQKMVGGTLDDHYHGDQDKAGRKSVDPRLLMLLEFFRQLYIRRKEVFKKMFPALHDEFAEMYNKIGDMVSHPLPKSDQIKVRTLQRSLSVGSPQTPVGDDSMRLERFKVRTVVPGGSASGGQGAPGTKSSGSTSK